MNNIKSVITLLNGANNSVNVIFVNNNNKTPVFRKLEIGTTLKDSFRQIIKSTCNAIISGINNSTTTLTEYDFDYSSARQAEVDYIDLTKAEYSTLNQYISSIPALENIKPFDENQDKAFLNNLSYYIISITDNVTSTRYLFFRKTSSKKTFIKGKGIMAHLSNGLYEQTSENPLCFDERIDCFAINNALYILDETQFLYIFKFYEQVAEQVNQVLCDIETKVPMRGVADFKEACMGDRRVYKKVISISQKPYIQNMSDNFIDLLQEKIFKLRDVTVRIENNKICYERSNLTDILRLLNDDYLESEYSNELTYLCNSKRPCK